LAEFPLQEAVRGRDVEVVWMPFELRPYPTPTLRPDGSYLQTAWARSVYPLAARLGVDIRLPSVSPQPYTRLAFEGLEFAKDHGRTSEYNSAVMRAFFQRSEDIGEPEVLARIAAEAGLDGKTFREALDTHVYEQRVAELLRHAYEDMDVTGVPLFVIGDVRLSGVQSEETLASVIDRELKARTPGP
jgi:predicted DsbA family dithiol-disulfide isomerase